eukprot:m.29723 g.29723  ORF g.29723 m.29723 type:complete len:201 (-) comp13773_c0_seq1:254-856(-)
MMISSTQLILVCCTALSIEISAAPAANYIEMHPVAKESKVIGPALKFTLEWEIKGSTMDCCFSADNQDAQHFIAIGFSGPKEPEQRMNNSDIVWAFPTKDGKGSLESVYSDSSAANPIGTPTLKITTISFELKDGTMKACFSRPLKGGHNPIANGQGLIWANGPLDSTTGFPVYHGADSPDPSGRTQTHRSDEVSAMQWS